MGRNCVIRNCEACYLWNLKIGNNVCISQRTFLCTGSQAPYAP